jgi:hypothetical protein
MLNKTTSRMKLLGQAAAGFKIDDILDGFVNA